MSADSWAICPVCDKERKEDYEKLQRAVEKEYGLLPANEWLRLKQKAEQPLDNRQYDLREYYTIGIRDNQFKVSYTARCQVCGFFYEYKHNEPISPESL